MLQTRGVDERAGSSELLRCGETIAWFSIFHAAQGVLLVALFDGESSERRGKSEALVMSHPAFTKSILPQRVRVFPSRKMCFLTRFRVVGLQRYFQHAFF